jgi:hypothetical protein
MPGHQLHGGHRCWLAVRADAGTDERRHPGAGEAHPPPLGAADNVIFLAPEVVDAGEGCQDSHYLVTP